ncbi:hypothetical protein [Haloarchaeobius sp. DFWS5]|uniref:hypothetical protein n=1 Tax=Haloarchaeobius sp. DFWS5 TaxID=3446114 RepID=UPI003EBC8DC9
MQSPLDPAELHDHSDITTRTEAATVDDEAFAYREAHAGMAIVGVPSDTGSVLLMRSPHGWRLPYVPVRRDADWLAVVREAGAAMTGEAVDFAAAERVCEITYRLDGETASTAAVEHDDEKRNDEKQVIGHDVVLRASPVSGEPVAANPVVHPWGELTLSWFDSVPDDAYAAHEDTVPDIRSILG